MEYIFITLKMSKDKVYELKIPSEITADELVEMLQKAFPLEGKNKKAIHVEPLGRILGKDEVLVEEGIYNGSQITLL